MRRPGAVLLDVLLALALFVGSASFCLAVTRSLFAQLDRSDRQRFAVDLACARMAELDAGLITLQEVRGEWNGVVGSLQREADLDPRGPDDPVWVLDLETTPTEFPGLTLVTITVTEEDAGRDAVTFTLRQLVALRDRDVEAYEADELLEGLPEPGSEPEFEP